MRLRNVREFAQCIPIYLTPSAVHFNVPTRSLYSTVPRLEVCKTQEVSVGEVLKVTISDLVLAVYHVDGTFYVTDDACTHGPGSLSEGILEGEVIECNFHQG